LAVATVDDIRAGGAGDHVGTETSAEHVRSISAFNGVVAAESEEDVGVCRPHEIVILLGARSGDAPVPQSPVPHRLGNPTGIGNDQ
jgi:hypothetical protein